MPKPKILAVEDNLDMQKTLLAIFSRLGCEITALVSAEKALEKLQAGYMPDLLILDFKLPGMSGPQLYRQLAMNPKWKQIPVVPFTSHSGQSMVTDVANEWQRFASVIEKISDQPARIVAKGDSDLSVPEQLIMTVANHLKASKTGLPEPYEKAVLELVNRVITHLDKKIPE